jgi:hypothetical protein
MLPVRLPGFQGRARPAARVPAQPAPAPPARHHEDAAARIDAARDRLRATIPPPDDERDEG